MFSCYFRIRFIHASLGMNQEFNFPGSSSLSSSSHLLVRKPILHLPAFPITVQFLNTSPFWITCRNRGRELSVGLILISGNTVFWIEEDFPLVQSFRPLSPGYHYCPCQKNPFLHIKPEPEASGIPCDCVDVQV